MRLGPRPDWWNGLLLVALLFLTGCGRVAGSGGGPQAGPSASPSPSPSYLGDSERWAPPTHLEGGRTVMPVTFPDGTRAELVFPPDLALEKLNVYPDTFALGGPRTCGLPVYGTQHDPHGQRSWFVGKAPLWEHVRPDGQTVQLWEGTPAHGGNVLVYRFGSWTVLVPCLDSAEPEHLRFWAESLHGEASPDGLLVLDSTPPLVVNPWRNQHAATIRMSGNDIIIDLRTSTESCDDGNGGDRDADDGVVQWCIQPRGGIYLYANGFTLAAERLLQGLVEDLEVRRVRPPV
jgi:hypothetical protein